MGCLKLSYYPTNFEVTKNYFKKELTPNFSKINARKSYELSNPITGNIHVVISDRKLPVDDGVYDSNGNQTSTTPDGMFDYFEPDVVFAADYYDGVGQIMPGRLFVSQDHRYGAQGSEVDQERDGSRDRITTYYRQGNLKTMRWDTPDPKPNASWSPYAMMQGNPVLYNDVLGDTVRYKSFGDRFRVGVTRLFNKDFNADFKTKRDDNLNTFTYDRDANASNRLKDATASMNLLDAPVDGRGTLANQYDVKYKNWELGNFDDTYTADALKFPFQLGWSVGKIGIGSLTGIGIGVANIFGADIGWGMANRFSFHTGANAISFGFGNYNKYNMFGMPLGSLPGKSPKIYPRSAPGLFGVRVGIGRLQPLNFIDIFGEIYDKQGFGHHLHINAATKRARKNLGGENTIDFKN